MDVVYEEFIQMSFAACKVALAMPPSQCCYPDCLAHAVQNSGLGKFGIGDSVSAHVTQQFHRGLNQNLFKQTHLFKNMLYLSTAEICKKFCNSQL